MDRSKINEITQKLGFLRDYSSLILPLVIVFAGIILLFLTPLVMGRKLKKEIIKESINERGRVLRLLRDDPVSSEQWREEKKYQDAYENDVNQIILLSKETGQRDLLSYQIFPEPQDSSMLIFEKFGQSFCKGIDEMLTRINAVECPSEIEINRALEKSKPGTVKSSRSGRAGRSLDKVETKIRNEVCIKKAKSGLIYAEASNISGYEFWKNYSFFGVKEAVDNCWFWQLGYWIIEDVIDSIENLNSSSKNVFTSPVKDLLGISFVPLSKEVERGRKSQGRGGVGISDSGRPNYVLSSKDDPRKFCTGRISNEDIDVVHFNIVVIVDVKKALCFMKELCSVKEHKFRGYFGDEQEQTFKHNQITILESSLEAIDRSSDEYELYRYGDDAVMKLTLVCEYVFDKSGYKQIKPKSAKESQEAAASGY